MAYATVDNVHDLAPHLPAFSPSSKPTIVQVQGFIADCERRVDATLAKWYVVPVTGPNAVLVLKDIVAHGALARVFRARAYGSNNPGDLAAADAAQRVYDGPLKALGSTNDSFELPADAVRRGGAVEKDRADLSSSHVTADVVDERPCITRGMVF